MKLAILHPFQFRYARGIERFTWSLATALTHKQVEVDLLTWHWPTPIDWGRTPPGLRIREVPDSRYLMERFTVPFYLNWLLRGHYDWVMLYFAGYGEAETINLLRRFRKQPYCVVFHFPREEVPHRFQEFEKYQLARQADHLISVSGFVAKGAEAQYGRACDVIYNGVDTDMFSRGPDARAISRQKLGISPDARMLVSVAALEERKGMQWAIRAMPRLLKEFPSFGYWILGEGAYRKTLEDEISQLGLHDHVHLVGNTTDVPAYLAAADVGCLLSHGEAFGLTVVEMMSMEIPVITSQHAPFEELIRPEWGIMVDEQDASAVAQALGSILRDPALGQRMGQAGRQETLERYTWSQVADQYIHLLNRR